MRAKSPTEVANALTVRRSLFGKEGVSWSPTVDGTELPKAPNDAFAEGAAQSVPVVLGSNRDEGNLFTYAWKLTFGHDLTEQEGLDVLGIIYSAAQIKAIQRQYPLAAHPSAAAWASVLNTDALFICPTRKAARALSAHGSPTYVYQFSHPWNPPLYPNLGAAHSFELPFVFGTSLGGRDIGDDEAQTSHAMIGYWTRFAASGDPNAADAPVWPRYEAGSETHLVLDKSITTGTGLGRDACDFWDNL